MWYTHSFTCSCIGTSTAFSAFELIASARANERKLIGQELHDNVNQILMTVKLYMTMIHALKEEEQSTKQKTISYLMMTIEEIRTLSGEFTGTKKRKTGLVTSMQSIIDDISFATSNEIKFTHQGNIESVGRDKKRLCFALCRSKLKNIVKYSEATKVIIQLLCRNDEVILQIKDNGVGFGCHQKRPGNWSCQYFRKSKIK